MQCSGVSLDDIVPRQRYVQLMRTRKRIACFMSMQQVSGAKTETGHQNKDFGPSHVARDWKDTNLVQEYLEERNPFDYGQELCNVSDISVNVDSSEAVGENVISKIVGATAAGFF